MEKSIKPFLAKAKGCYELKELERLGLTPTLPQRDQIIHFIALLLKWNKAAGLISPKDEANVFIRHFCDSLQPLLLFGFKKNGTVLDIGAGGGFPSLPIAIFRPDLKFVLAESNRKKAVFLKELQSDLALLNMQVHNGRADTIDTSKMEKKFDYVLSRGVGSLAEFATLAKPLISPDGNMYTFKSKTFADELSEITSGKLAKGIRIREIAEYDLANQILGLNLVSLELTK